MVRRIVVLGRVATVVVMAVVVMAAVAMVVGVATPRRALRFGTVVAVVRHEFPILQETLCLRNGI